jgi:hypothetical protein
VVKKVAAALLLIAAVAVFLTIREQGRDKAFGGALAPLESVRVPGGPVAGVADASLPASGGTDYQPMVDRVRDRVNHAMDRSERRSAY